MQWNSESNAIYRIEFVDECSTNTLWRVLYDDYPSHGTSTFWTDTGDYLADPVVKPPNQVTNRCYRVVKTGTNDSPPQVTLTVPTNSFLSGNITVSVSATGAYAIAHYSIFVDGDEVGHGDSSTTNYVINTCEWANGPHTLFAVARDGAGIGETASTAPPTTNAVHPNIAASSPVSVLFSNYISRWSFSEPFFEPELGQTQNISAVFAADSDWALTITDSSGATNRTVTGTGTTMSFAWDGKGDGGASLPNGVYDFTLTASQRSLLAGSSGGTATSPLTKAKKVNGAVGTFGVAYRSSYWPDWYESLLPPTDPLSLYPRGYVDLGGGLLHPTFNPLWPYAYHDANGFAKAMGEGDWKPKFKLADYDFLPEHLRSSAHGGSNVFNTVNIGLIVMHGVKGVSCDHTIAASCPKETYLPFPCLCGGRFQYDWVRLSECDFGSTNLHWLAIQACNILSDPNFEDMWYKGVLPINEHLHLLLGAASVVYDGGGLPETWANDMLGKLPDRRTPNTIMDAWFYAGAKTQKEPQKAHPEFGPVILRVAGWDPCFSDTLLDWSDPDTTQYIYWEDRQVAP